MFAKSKKRTYTTPAIQKISLSDDAVDNVSGGVKPKTEDSDDKDSASGYDKNGDNTGDSSFNVPGYNKEDFGNANVGQGRGRGGGCDGVSYHRNARTFSSGRNSGC